MNKKFIVAGIVASFTNLALNAAAYAVFLKGFFYSHPAVSEEFAHQLAREPGDLIWWAMALTTFSMGFFITLVMQWSGARTFFSGLKSGALVATLFWVSVNAGLYASSNHFSGPGVLADTPFSIFAMTIAAAAAARMLREADAGHVSNAV